MITAVLTLAGGLSGIVRMALAGAIVALLVWPLARSAGVAEGRAALQSEITAAALSAENERIRTMRSARAFLTMTLVSMLFALAGCQSTSAPACAGFRLANLSPAGTVALIQADRAGADRVEGNDENYRRRGCA